MKRTRETRPSEQPTRRHLLTGGAAAGAVTLAGLAGVAPSAANAAVDWEPKLFTTEQAALLERLCDLLLPRTGTPGALDAGVPQYIDLEMSLAEADDRLAFLGGLGWIDQHAVETHGKAFLEISETAQQELMNEISDASHPHPREVRNGAAFFRLLKRRALFAYFTSEKGRVETLGRPAKVERQIFEGCQHEDGAHNA